MIPSRAWFPSRMQDRAVWFENFTTQFGNVAISLGFVAADVTALDQDNQVVQFVTTNTTTLESVADAIRQYRIIITEGDIGDPNPEFPEYTTTQPGLPVPTGIFERLDKLVKRIRASPTYTDEVGALLGIIPSPAPQPEGVLKPVIKASESFESYKFSVNVTRLGMTAFKVQIQRNGNGTWQDAAFATNNPCEVTVTPTTPGDPERILVRAILLDKNAPVGEPSDPTYVTVNP